MADRSIGIMDPAYFVGRRELLEWLNSTLALNLTKIEQTASGAVACQLMGALFPGSIPMHKVNWEAKQDFQFVPNYKLLQKAFRLHGVARHVDVPKLIRAKYQDNLEFMQWFKAFFESQALPDDYDPVAARAQGRGGRRANSNLVTDAKVSAPARASRAVRPAPQASGAAPPPVTTHNKENRTRRGAPAAAAAAPGPATCRDTAAEDALRLRVEGLERELATKAQECVEAETQMESIDGEREFYYRKLLAVESMLQEEEAKLPAGELGDSLKMLIKKALKIMYDTEDAASAAVAEPDEVGEADEAGDVNTAEPAVQDGGVATAAAAPVVDAVGPAPVEVETF